MSDLISKISEALNLNDNQERAVGFLLIGLFLLVCSFLSWRHYKSMNPKKSGDLKEAFVYASYTKSIIGMCMGLLFVIIGILIILLNLN